MAAKRRAEILLHVDEAADVPLYRQIYEQVRDAIVGARLTPGDKLVSIRRLADDLRVSHTTVEQAYLQLATEGLVRNVPRSGYVVEQVDTEYLALAHAAHEEAVEQARDARSRNAFYAENRTGAQARYDFSFANLQPDSFPANTWRKLVVDVLYRNDCPELSRYSYTDDRSSLQSELARYLGRTRGVACAPEQVVVQAGTGDALTTLLQLFDRDRDVVGMEEPGYQTVHEVARRLGFKMVPLPSDEGPEAFLEAVERAKPRIVFTTPSHQFPTCSLLHLDARTRLLKWAERNDAYIIEDDSCNEFRYTTHPIPSLQSLDAYGRVVYLCNISKTLSPALRIAYMVLPPKLLNRYWDLFNYAHPPVSWLDQEVLARFIAEGHLDAHVRKTAKANHRRHDELLRCLRAQMEGGIGIRGTDTGMHLYVTVSNGMTQTQLLESALAHDVKVYGTSRMWFSEPPTEGAIIIGFSAIAYEDIAPGVAALREAWFPGA